MEKLWLHENEYHILIGNECYVYDKKGKYLDRYRVGKSEVAWMDSKWTKAEYNSLPDVIKNDLVLA